VKPQTVWPSNVEYKRGSWNKMTVFSGNRESVGGVAFTFIMGSGHHCLQCFSFHLPRVIMINDNAGLVWVHVHTPFCLCLAFFRLFNCVAACLFSQSFLCPCWDSHHLDRASFKVSFKPGKDTHRGLTVMAHPQRAYSDGFQ